MERTSRAQWAKRVERWRDSGLTAKEFAAETGVKASTLSYWGWRLRSEAQQDGGAPSSKASSRRGGGSRPTGVQELGHFVEVTAPVVEAVATLEVVLDGGARVRVPATQRLRRAPRWRRRPHRRHSPSPRRRKPDRTLAAPLIRPAVLPRRHQLRRIANSHRAPGPQPLRTLQATISAPSLAISVWCWDISVWCCRFALAVLRAASDDERLSWALDLSEEVLAGAAEIGAIISQRGSTDGP